MTTEPIPTVPLKRPFRAVLEGGPVAVARATDMSAVVPATFEPAATTA